MAHEALPTAYYLGTFLLVLGYAAWVLYRPARKPGHQPHPH